MSAPTKVPVRRAPWHPDVPSADECRARLERLTGRQAEILGLFARGWSKKHVAFWLEIRVETVNLHITELHRRLDVTGRDMAVAMYYRAGEPVELSVAS